MADPRKIYLAKPGGQREGPYNLEQINEALASGKYGTSDYWAWHEGLAEWGPLHAIAGVVASTQSSGDSVAKEVPLACGVHETRLEAAVPGLTVAGRESPVGIETSMEPFTAGQTQGDGTEPPPIGAPGSQAEERKENTVFCSATDLSFSASEAGVALEPMFPPGDLAASGVISKTAEPDAQANTVFFSATDTPLAEPAEVSSGVEAARSWVYDDLATGTEPDRPTADDSLQAVPAEPVPARSNPDPTNPRLSAVAEPLMSLADTPISVLQAYEAVVRAAMVAAEHEGTPASTNPGTESSASMQVSSAGSTTSRVSFEDAPGAIAFRSGNAEDEEALANATLGSREPSGMPFVALEHLFVFKTGDRSVLWESPTLAGQLKQIVGEELSVIRQKTPRDVIFNCELSHLFKRDGSISEAVWRAMSVRAPEVVNKARAKLSRTCVHSFQVEDDSVIAVVLFYDVKRCKQS